MGAEQEWANVRAQSRSEQRREQVGSMESGPAEYHARETTLSNDHF